MTPFAHAPHSKRAARRSLPTTSTPRRSRSTAASCGSPTRSMPSMLGDQRAISTGSRGAHRRCSRRLFPAALVTADSPPAERLAEPRWLARGRPGTTRAVLFVQARASRSGIVRRDAGAGRVLRPLHHALVPAIRWVTPGACVGTVAQGAFSAVFFGIAVLAPALRERYDLSLTQVGMLLASVSIGATVSVLPWGVLADRVGERAVIATGLAAAGAGAHCVGLGRKLPRLSSCC